jgi:ribonuclease J
MSKFLLFSLLATSFCDLSLVTGWVQAMDSMVGEKSKPSGNPVERKMVNAVENYLRSHADEQGRLLHSDRLVNARLRLKLERLRSDRLYRTGADVFHMPADAVHASGHAAAEELRLMLSLVKPRWFIPIHGERRHLQHHARLAEEVGIPHDHVIICEDGDVVEVGERVAKVDRVQAGMTFVDGLGIGDVGTEVLRDRRKLSGDGVVVVVVTVDSQTGELVGGPDIVNRGFVHEETSGDILEEARLRVVDAIGGTAEAHVVDPSALQQDIRRVLGRYFNEVTQRKPVILPVIMEV